MKNKSTICLISVIAFFSVAYFLVSIVPHINFQTNAFDLGIFNQAIRQYSHLQIGPNTVRGVSNLLADHLEGILFLFAPFYWLFGTYALLLIQIASVILGALGVYLLVKRESKNNQWIALTALVVFLLFFGVFTALAFDYHNNVIGAMLIPWLLYFISSRKFRAYYLVLILFLLTKENMALISVFLGVSMMIFEDRKIKKHGLITFLASIAYFFVSLKIITYLNGSYDHWPYASLGDSPLEALKFVLVHPIDALTLLVDDPSKIKMWLLILVSGGILAILKPKYFLLLIPVIGQKFFSNEPSFWGYTFHYSIEFAPIIAIGAVLFIATLKNKRFQRLSLVVLVFLNIAILTQVRFYNGDKIFRIFDADYYELSNREELSYVLDRLKNAESVSAQNTIVPHLKNDRIYLFPQISDSEYIALNLDDDNIWPFKNKQELIDELEKLKKNPKYLKIYESNSVYLFESVADMYNLK